MKTLTGMKFHGTQCSKRTNWQTWPSFGLLKFSDGTSHYLPSGKDYYDAGLLEAKAMGVDCSEFEAKAKAAEKAMAYPDKPESELYFHNYGYEKPIELGKWEWSCTFGRWSRLVTFKDGWNGYTYPKI